MLAGDTDVDGDSLSVSDYDNTSANGASVTVASTGAYSYDPTGSTTLQALDDTESVDDTFDYEVSDGTLTDTATVTVTVSGVNDAPVATNDTKTTDEDTPVVVDVAHGVLANDDDADGDTLKIQVPGTSATGKGAAFTIGEFGNYSYDRPVRLR